MGLSFLVLCFEMSGAIFLFYVCHVLKKISNRIVRRVSVIIIFLNAEAFIAEAIDSGLALPTSPAPRDSLAHLLTTRGLWQGMNRRWPEVHGLTLQ
jgi:hypothetical protein